MFPSKKFVIKRCVPGFVRSKFFLFFIYHRYGICLLVTLLPRNIPPYHFLAMPYRLRSVFDKTFLKSFMITTWSPQVSRAPLLKLWKMIPQELTASPLYPLRYPANRIFWRTAKHFSVNAFSKRVFYEQMYMIHIHRHVYNLNIELFTGFPNDFLCRFRYFTFQYLPAILR